MQLIEFAREIWFPQFSSESFDAASEIWSSHMFNLEMCWSEKNFANHKFLELVCTFQKSTSSFRGLTFSWYLWADRY